jgi:16S rRNA (adenine1518-N6/adenine1519-N6)-dimethyltransferase
VATTGEYRVGYPLELPALDVPGLLREFGLRPNKRLGQNFLIDPSALQRVISAAGLSREETVLEIGPGLGSLTRLMASQVKQVVAVELDASLIPILLRVLQPFDNVRVIQGDILKLDAGVLAPASEYLVVANIPYYITSAVIRHLLEADTRPRRMVLTVQREVAQRICAQPGEMSLLALSVQVYGRPEITARIPSGAFYPAPKVDSAVVRVELYSEPVIPAHLLESFFWLARAGFNQKRKTLRNSLAAGLGFQPEEVEKRLHAAGINPRSRAEALSLAAWDQLTEQFSPNATIKSPLKSANRR